MANSNPGPSVGHVPSDNFLCLYAFCILPLPDGQFDVLRVGIHFAASAAASSAAARSFKQASSAATAAAIASSSSAVAGATCGGVNGSGRCEQLTARHLNASCRTLD